MRNRAQTCVAVALLSAVLSAGWSAPSRAAFVTSGCAAVNEFCTLEELQATSAFINIDNIVFNNFDSLFFAPELIKATPIDSPGSGGGSVVGLRFEPVDPTSNPWTVSIPPASSPAAFDGFIGYDINVLSGIGIGASTLTATFILDVSGGFFEVLDATKNIGRGPLSPVALQVNCADFPLGDCNGRTAVDSGAFGSVASLSVEDSFGGRAVRVTGGGNVVIGIAQITNTFTRVPEPATLSLFGVGLLGLGFIMRRRRAGA